jgi:hypothetical protein
VGLTQLVCFSSEAKIPSDWIWPQKPTDEIKLFNLLFLAFDTFLFFSSQAFSVAVEPAEVEWQ